MHLLFLTMALAQAARSPVCSLDFLDYPLPSTAGSAWMPRDFLEGAVRPGLRRLQEDVCRCLPRRPSRWPDVVMAALWVEPNKGKIRIEYTVEQEKTPQIDRMLQCMGEPKFSVEPMPYKTDIVYPDGREEVFPRYPVLLYLNDEPRSEERSSR